ncbi:CGNR zinc finger domain-containing protein [Paramicrobacterium sp. CJ85]|uniref:CGNR zinc finger domain-containing protein n=1 Tax=Paramicrobacterium sp. CJ85 TaxID=3445355 RepID=UPI003F6174FE
MDSAAYGKTKEDAVVDDEELLVALLNSAPVHDGQPTDELDGASGHALLSRFGGTGTTTEVESAKRMRDALQRVIRGQDASDELQPLLARASLRPHATAEGIDWQLDAPADERLAIRAARAWSQVQRDLPGRLRPCANTECNLFLIDHSRPGTAKWCSMATCGNRMKVRAHAKRQRSTSPASS